MPNVESDMAREKARKAILQEHPVRAREWLETAAAAERLDLPAHRIADELERIANALVWLVDQTTGSDG